MGRMSETAVGQFVPERSLRTRRLLAVLLGGLSAMRQKAALAKAGTADKDTMIDAMEGMTVQSPTGAVTIKGGEALAPTENGREARFRSRPAHAVIPGGGLYMKTLIVVSLLAFCVLGAMMTPVAAQAAGPFCLQVLEFGDVAEVFALPTGGGQLILTGKSLTFADAYSGAGYVDGTDFVFTLSSGLLPGFMEGRLNIGTGDGLGSITFVDNNEIQGLTFKFFAPPCEIQ